MKSSIRPLFQGINAWLSPRSPRTVTAVGIAALAMAIGAGSGCLHKSKVKAKVSPPYRITLFLMAEPGSRAPAAPLFQLTSDTGQTALVLSQPLLTSADITAAEAVSESAGTCLKFTLSPQERYHWMQLCREAAGQTIVVCVDGWMRFQLPLPPPPVAEAEPYLILCGKWNDAEMAGIVRQAPENYQQLKHQTP